MYPTVWDCKGDEVRFTIKSLQAGLPTVPSSHNKSGQVVHTRSSVTKQHNLAFNNLVFTKRQFIIYTQKIMHNVLCA